MVVIFGTPGLFEVFDVYDLLNEKIKTSKKPIYPVLPSILTAEKEVQNFISKGRVFFPDEVMLGKALCRTYFTPKPAAEQITIPEIDIQAVRNIIDKAKNGYLDRSSRLQCCRTTRQNNRRYPSESQAHFRLLKQNV